VGGSSRARSARAAGLLEVQVDLRSDLNEGRISDVKSARDLSAMVFPHPERRANILSNPQPAIHVNLNQTGNGKNVFAPRGTKIPVTHIIATAEALPNPTLVET